MRGFLNSPHTPRPATRGRASDAPALPRSTSRPCSQLGCPATAMRAPGQHGAAVPAATLSPRTVVGSANSTRRLCVGPLCPRLRCQPPASASWVGRYTDSSCCFLKAPNTSLQRGNQTFQRNSLHPDYLKQTILICSGRWSSWWGWFWDTRAGGRASHQDLRGH